MTYGQQKPNFLDLNPSFDLVITLFMNLIFSHYIAPLRSITVSAQYILDLYDHLRTTQDMS